MIWIDSLIQGILLGGLYALFAAGAKPCVWNYASGEFGPWRFDRLLGLYHLGLC